MPFITMSQAPAEFSTLQFLELKKIFRF